MRVSFRRYDDIYYNDRYDCEDAELDFLEEMARSEWPYSDPEELWSDIDAYSGYEVSTQGRVWSNKTGRFLKPYIGKNGYPYVNLMSPTGRVVHRYIHQLIAEAFVYNDDPENKWLVRHLDDCRVHCTSDNLRWGTVRDNYEDSVRNGRRHTPTKEENILRAKKIMKPIIAVDAKTGEELYFESGRAAARYFGVDPAHVSTALSGKLRQLHGYNLKFARR